MKNITKKIITLLTILILSSCISKKDLNLVQLSFYHPENSTNKTTSNPKKIKSFSFTVSEEFLEKYENSKISNIHPQMSISEARILKYLLKKDDYCRNKKGDISFVIQSKQQRIYDITFSHLIEQNYRAKPITPVTYFGKCN